jgi:hypothetical protein
VITNEALPLVAFLVVAVLVVVLVGVVFVVDEEEEEDDDGSVPETVDPSVGCNAGSFGGVVGTL